MKIHHIAGVGLAIALAGCSKPAPRPTAPSVPSVSVARPVAETVNEWDEFTGRLASPETVEIRARVPGYIDRVHFKEGGDVKVGDLLFTIDPRPYRAVVDRVTAELGAARARAELARSEAKRAEGLAASKAISTDTFETRVKTATEAAEAVRSAEAALKVAQLDLEFTEVRAPIAGRISDARVTAGNLVTGGSASSSTLLTTIVSLDRMYCYLDVDEASALRYRQLYREGKRASALFGPIPAEMGLGNEQGFPHQGTIDFVDNQLNPATGTIRVRAVFPNGDKLMAPGFFARVRMPGNGEYPALLIRDIAIGSDQGRAFVLALDDNDTATYRTIKPGPMVKGLRVVREGLTEKDRIIVNGLMSTRAGTKVNPQLVPMATNTVATAETAPKTGTTP
ncbi:MAG: efflux RND transporter periplasmic adaptor subunit [Verrucomicrobiales bacterium]|nr:efflux RND transporter periplasmic adaptor subunit [Verrucomicrobiales bacterium]